jgi:hypothetical protein
MNTETGDLLEAIDALTKPQRLADWVESDGQRALYARTHEPLLEQLRQAIASNVGEKSAQGGQTSTRSLIDVGAFTLYEEIDGVARGWVLEVGGRAGRNFSALDVLRAWFVLYSVRERLDIEERISRLRGWAARIGDLLSPPTKQELRRPCPSCSKSWAVLGRGEETQRVSALEYTIRDGLEACYVECRSCGSRWSGAYQLRALRVLIDDLESVEAA